MKGKVASILLTALFTCGGFAHAQVIEPPRFASKPMPPKYPMDSWRAGEQGDVVVRVYVETSGEPSQIDIERSTGYERLDKSAIEAAAKLRFVPAKRDGQAIGAWHSVPYFFRLD